MRLHANTFTITNVSISKFNNNAVLQGEEKCIKIFTLFLTLDKQRKLSLNNSRESSRSFELDQTTFHRKCKNVIQKRLKESVRVKPELTIKDFFS